MWKNSLYGYLSFTKRDRTGILVLISLVIFFIILPVFYPYFIKEKIYDHTVFEKAIASLQIKPADSLLPFEKQNFEKRGYQNNYQASAENNYSHSPKGELFYFDPNTASILDWKKLGVRDKTITTIQKFISKGGKFHKKEDIGKIWGLHEDEIQRLIPFIQIHNTNESNFTIADKFEKKEYKPKIYTPAIVDINDSDTAAFIALPGIGSKLSQRIINFRDKLGGFYKVEQIGETFGLPDSTFQKIRPWLKVSNPEIRRININTASIDEFKLHPYIRYTLGNAIVQYRTQHGNYKTVSDIKRIMVVTEEVFSKLEPYLTVN